METMTTDVPPAVRLKNGKVPAFLRGKKIYQSSPDPAPEVQPKEGVDYSPPGSPEEDIPLEDAGFVLGTGGEGDEIAARMALDMMEIRLRLRLEKEFEGIDPFNLEDEDFERAMELGFLPLPMVVDYIADMVVLAQLGELGRPIPPWAVQIIEAATYVQRAWKGQKDARKFKGHAHLVDSLFGEVATWDQAAATKASAGIKKGLALGGRKEGKDPERFWKAYMQHVNRVHAGNKKNEDEDDFEARVTKSFNKLKTVKGFNKLKSSKAIEGYLKTHDTGDKPSPAVEKAAAAVRGSTRRASTGAPSTTATATTATGATPSRRRTTAAARHAAGKALQRGSWK